jgi:hypothetical protein
VADIAALQAASRAFDQATTMDTATAYMHYIARPEQNPVAARRAAEDFIEERLAWARVAAEANDRARA